MAVVSPDPSTSVVANCGVIADVVVVSCGVVAAFDSVEDDVLPAIVVSVVPVDDVAVIGGVLDDVVLIANVVSAVAVDVVPVVPPKVVAVSSITLLVNVLVVQFTLAAAKKKANFVICFWNKYSNFWFGAEAVDSIRFGLESQSGQTKNVKH